MWRDDRNGGKWCALTALLAVGLFWAWAGRTTRAQEKAKPPGRRPPKKIAIEPRVIDPIEVLPNALTVSATADFSDSSLREFVQWLEEKQNQVVLLDARALRDAGISPAEPISDRLDHEPIYLLLSRLRSLGIGWYFEDDVLHLTALAKMDRQVTVPHDLSRLLASGYTSHRLETAIMRTVAPTSWQAVGEGQGTVSFLGDVMFVRQSDWAQYQIVALLKALEKPAERTYVLEPKRHLDFRGRLEGPMSVSFDEVPLADVIAQLGRDSGIDMRLHTKGLEQLRVRSRQPVTLKVRDRKLRTILDAVLLQFHLRWMLRDGVLWITSPTEAEDCFKTAVYDVSDLCRDETEANALTQALKRQTSASFWGSGLGGGLMQFGSNGSGNGFDREDDAEDGALDGPAGSGTIVMVRPGTMVIYAIQPAHDAVLALLRSYRRALLATKPRKTAPAGDPITTVYYRLPETVAKDLERMLPKLVGPAWHPEGAKEKLGEMIRISSEPETLDAPTDDGLLMLPQAVLVIRHRASVHRKIGEVIERVLSGDFSGEAAGGFGGGGLGGGGFGGGFFRVQNEAAKAKR